ncbi:MAG: hypothetical protein WCF98_04730 [Synechococcus sp. ELA057]
MPFCSAPSLSAAERIDQELASEAPDFQALAQTLMGCGMAAEAATCHSWSLLPPDPALWQQALRNWKRRIGVTEPLASAPPAAADRSDGAAEAELQAIQALFEAGDASAACARITRLSHDSSLPPHLCNRAAMLHASSGDFWQAERWYRTSLVQQAAQVQPWFGLAAALQQQGACDEALEAASTGLGQHPDHPWGLKLRQHALQALGARQTLRRLADEGQLPFPLPPDQQEPAQGFAAIAHFNTLALRHKLQLQAMLQGEPRRIWCVGPASFKVLQWLDAQGILPSGTHVQVFADPDADLQPLGADGPAWQKEPSLPLYRLRHQESPPGLTILAPTRNAACPLVIAELFKTDIPLLVDRRLELSPPRHHEVMGCEHWRLLTPMPPG